MISAVSLNHCAAALLSAAKFRNVCSKNALSD